MDCPFSMIKTGFPILPFHRRKGRSAAADLSMLHPTSHTTAEQERRPNRRLANRWLAVLWKLWQTR
jgi:hypothetical protein